MQDNVYEIYNGIAIQSTATGNDADYVDLFDEPDYNRITNLAMVEKFVERIQKSKDVAFDIQPLGTRYLVREKEFFKFYQPINRVLEHTYPDHLQYSPRVEVLFEACKSLNIQPGQFQFGLYLEVEPRSQWIYADIFNELILEIRDRCQKSKFKTRLNRHERNVRRRRARGVMWTKDLFEASSRYLFLIINLSYREEYRRQVTPQIIQADLHHLFNNRRNNELLRGIQAYICKIEEGDKTGLHAHLLIAYEADRRDDINLARSIGDYWRVVTQGRGSYWNSNKHKQRNALLGYGDCTGTIDHYDIPKREALLKYIAYLCKADQYLKSKTAKFKTFWISKPPEKKDGMLGRRRKVVDKSRLRVLEQYITQHGWDHHQLLLHEHLDAVAV